MNRRRRTCIGNRLRNGGILDVHAFLSLRPSRPSSPHQSPAEGRERFLEYLSITGERDRAAAVSELSIECDGDDSGTP